jgi:iojap-like ribosome-associated protein
MDTTTGPVDQPEEMMTIHEPASIPTPVAGADAASAPESAESVTLTVGNQRGDGLERALAAARVARENRGREIMLLDLRKITPVFDYFLIVTGASRRQVHAIAEEIHLELKRVWNDRRIGFEGIEDSRWIILDYGDLVVHVFDEEARGYYRLEDLWGGAEVVTIPEDGKPSAG